MSIVDVLYPCCAHPVSGLNLCLPTLLCATLWADHPIACLSCEWSESLLIRTLPSPLCAQNCVRITLYLPGLCYPCCETGLLRITLYQPELCYPRCVPAPALLTFALCLSAIPASWLRANSLLFNKSIVCTLCVFNPHLRHSDKLRYLKNLHRRCFKTFYRLPV